MPIGALIAITLISKNVSNFLQPGRHVCEIKSVAGATPQGENPWKDKTPQLKVTFECDGRIFSAWYNLKGFKTYKQLTAKEQKSGLYVSMGTAGYAVVKATGMRIEDTEKTEAAMNILCTLAAHSGIPEGTQFSETELVGRTVGIIIGENNNANDRVKGTFAPSGVAATEDVAS